MTFQTRLDARWEAGERKLMKGSQGPTPGSGRTEVGRQRRKEGLLHQGTGRNQDKRPHRLTRKLPSNSVIFKASEQASPRVLSFAQQIYAEDTRGVPVTAPGAGSTAVDNTDKTSFSGASRPRGEADHAPSASEVGADEHRDEKPRRVTAGDNLRRMVRAVLLGEAEASQGPKEDNMGAKSLQGTFGRHPGGTGAGGSGKHGPQDPHARKGLGFQSYVTLRTLRFTPISHLRKQTFNLSLRLFYSHKLGGLAPRTKRRGKCYQMHFTGHANFRSAL